MVLLCQTKPKHCDCRCINLANTCQSCSQKIPAFHVPNSCCIGNGFGIAGVCCVPTYQLDSCKSCEKPKEIAACIPLCHPCAQVYKTRGNRCAKNLLFEEHLLQEKGCCGGISDPTTSPCKPNGVKYTDGCCPPPCKPCCLSPICNPLVPCCVKIEPCQPRGCPAKSCRPPPYCCPHPCDTKIDIRCCPPCKIERNPCQRPAVPACPKKNCPAC